MNDILTPCGFTRQMLTEHLRAGEWLDKDEEIHKWEIRDDILIVHIRRIEGSEIMDEIMTTQEVARLLKLHPITVINRCKDGTLPGYKLGSVYRFTRKDVERLLGRKKYRCEQCHDTGWYGDNGPGMAGNREYMPCECREKPPA